MRNENFYITTAIPYVNGAPHLGHAYEAIITDALARFKRLDGFNVFFLTGVDEHGEKNAKTAKQKGMTPAEFTSGNTALFKEMIKYLNISNDGFVKTTEERHFKASQTLWKIIKKNGDIKLGQYSGWYSIREEAYFTEDELNTADDGQKFTPNGTEVEWVEEESYFFKLSKYTNKLLKYYEENPEFIQPETRRNEIINFVKQGLRDLSVSRQKNRLEWGIPVPDDDNHVMYVWLDALTNYITGVGYPDENSEKFKLFWPADYHVIGKDITRFHTIYWPAFLMAANLPLPKTVWAHGFINVHGQKMSKSIGNVVSPEGMVETYGLDQIRYFLLREIPHGQDGNFSHEQAIQRINADLANGLGNLAQRTLSMIHKNCEAKIPHPGELTADDKALLDKVYAEAISDTTRTNADSFQFHTILRDLWTLVSACDSYIDQQAPWALKKTDIKRMGTVLYVLTEAIRCITIAVQPYVPGSAEKLLEQLQIPEVQRSFAHISPDYSMTSGTTIEKPEGVFPRLVEDEPAAA